MMDSAQTRRVTLTLTALVAVFAIGAGNAGTDGPADQGPRLPPRQDGDAVLGKQVFRFETFGNEGFWTDAVRLPAGIAAKHVTPLQALQLGLSDRRRRHRSGDAGATHDRVAYRPRPGAPRSYSTIPP